MPPIIRNTSAGSTSSALPARKPSHPLPPKSSAHPRQPRVFRNRSLDYENRHNRPLLGLFSAKALRSFHRGRLTPDKLKLPRDRPLVHHIRTEKPVEQAIEPAPARNDDSFSSLPSTHASKDPFLNDDVPIEISRLEAREDRPRAGPIAVGRRDDDGPGLRSGPTDVPFGLASRGEMSSPPASMSSTSTFRKRSSLWKRTYDPENEFQSIHERQILKAVALSEAAVKERSVAAAQQLARIVAMQVGELDLALAEVEKHVEFAGGVARALPSTRDARFEGLLYGDKEEGVEAGDRVEAERVFLELQWTERVWDVEAMVIEKRFEESVAAVEKLNEDGIGESASPRTRGKFEGIVERLVKDIGEFCTRGGAATAAIYSPLLARVGMAEHAREVVLNAAESELMDILEEITGAGMEVMPRTVTIVLDRTLGMFQQTYAVYTRISDGGLPNSSFFVAWVVDMSDKVYAKFVSPILTKMRRADPVKILATIEAARYPRENQDGGFQRNGESLAALLVTRITTHLRKDLDGPIRDAERQLMERARVYASAIPGNWSEGPYQSGKAICDELNILCKGLEGALMNLDAETDILTGNLLVRLAMEYCTILLEMGSKAVAENDTLSTKEVQEGIWETFSMIGNTMLRLHEKYGRIPSLDRVADVLTSCDVDEVKVLYAEVAKVATKEGPSPSVAVSSPFLVPLAKKIVGQ